MYATSLLCWRQGLCQSLLLSHSLPVSQCACVWAARPSLPRRGISSSSTNNTTFSPLDVEVDALKDVLRDHPNQAPERVRSALDRCAQIASQQEHPVACYLLGSAHLEGVLGMPSSVAAAGPHLLKAAKAGLTEAQFLVAYLYQTGSKDFLKPRNSAGGEMESNFTIHVDPGSGRGVLVEEHKDQETEGGGEVRIDRSALKDARLHARLEKMREELKRRQGVSYEGPDEFQQIDFAKALKWYEILADKGFPEAKVQMGNILMEGSEDVPTDPTRALQLYQEAVEQGSRDALYNLGVVFFQGEHVTRDVPRALSYFERAAAAGDAPSKLWIAHTYLSGEMGSEPHWTSRGTDLLKEAVAAKHPEAMFYLAQLFRSGVAPASYESEAIDLLKESAQLGNPSALYALGDVFASGSDGQQVDFRMAKKFFELAGLGGDTNALVSLGALHFHGLGCDQDYRRAFDTYMEAAKLGNSDGWRNLAAMYADGKGTPKNDELARHCLQKALELDGGNDAEASPLPEVSSSLQSSAASS